MVAKHKGIAQNRASDAFGSLARLFSLAVYRNISGPWGPKVRVEQAKGDIPNVTLFALFDAG